MLTSCGTNRWPFRFPGELLGNLSNGWSSCGHSPEADRGVGQRAAERRVCVALTAGNRRERYQSRGSGSEFSDKLSPLHDSTSIRRAWMPDW